MNEPLHIDLVHTAEFNPAFAPIAGNDWQYRCETCGALIDTQSVRGQEWLVLEPHADWHRARLIRSLSTSEIRMHLSLEAFEIST